MEIRDASVRNRLILWLASGLFVAATVLAIGSRRPPAAVQPAAPAIPELLKSDVGPKAATPGSSRTPGDLVGPPNPSRAGASTASSTRSLSGAETSARSDVAFVGSRRNPQEEDDEALFAAMERLEQRMAAGMGRARESVLALEYTAAGEPGDARRAAVAVVIDGRRGEVLSVRIDRPPTPPGEPGGGPSPIVARDAFGRRHLARWIAADPETGLTLLQIPSGVLRSIRPAADGPTLGGQVFVVGNPFGLGHSVSRGQVSGLNRSLKLKDLQLNGLIQVQTPLFPGDNGAAVVNYRGQLLGLIRGGLALPSPPDDKPSGRGNDLGFAIPADDALWIASQLRESGRVDRAYLGVRFEADSPDATAPEGATLREVLPETPAARCGLQAGERVVSFDGRPTRSALDLKERLDRTPAEKYVRLEVVKGDGPQRQQRSVWIQTVRRPDPAREPATPPAAAIADKPKAPQPSAPAPSPVVVPTSAVASAPAPAPSSTPAPEAAPAPSPDQPQPKALADPVPPPRAEELQISLPRAVVERIDELERRLERLEHTQSPAPPNPDAP